MPKLSTYFIRSSLLCFAVGFVIAAFLLTVKTGFVDARLWLWRPVHIVLLINGWFVQFTVGVAYWIFPRIKGSDRGRPRAARAALVLFQIGVVSNALALLSPFNPAMSAALGAAMISYMGGVVCFAWHAYPRVRAAMVSADFKLRT